MQETLTLLDIKWHFVIGGLGLFLFGISLMGDNLTNFAGTKIREYIEKYTDTPFKALLLGIVLTALLQSSSATTVITISLVGAGLMGLEQAIGIILGSNIGSTITAILIGFNLEYFAYYIILVGVVMMMLAGKKKLQYLSSIIIGFGLLFIGLSMMGGELKQLQYVAGFSNLIVKISQTPIIGVFFGAITTAIVQSSAAIIGVVQKLYQSDVLSLTAALSLVMSANIGTTITAILASLGGSVASKRTTLFHFLFNVSVAGVALLFLNPYILLVARVTELFNLNPMMSIAMAHFIFNIVGVLIYFPFVKKMPVLLNFAIKGEVTSYGDLSSINLDENMIVNFPIGALAQAKNGILQVGILARNVLSASEQFLITKDKKYFKEVNQLEEIINSLDTKLNTYLIKIAKQRLPEDAFSEYAINLQVEKNLERIADLAQNLAEYYEIIFDGNEDLSAEAKAEVLEMYQVLYKNLDNALIIYETSNKILYATLKADEIYLNQLESKFRRAHFNRLTHQDAVANHANSMFVDILSTMERIGDHAFNIASGTFDPIKTHKEKK